MARRFGTSISETTCLMGVYTQSLLVPIETDMDETTSRLLAISDQRHIHSRGERKLLCIIRRERMATVVQ